MSKWDEYKALFLEEHKEFGFTPRQFCEKHGLKYATARRYIKLPQANLKSEAKEPKEPKAAKKPGVKAGTQNTHLVKHGGYTKYFKNDLNQLVDGTTLDDELDLCRARIHLVMKAMEGISQALDSPDKDTITTASLYESLFKAENALDRNVSRVESIVRTLSTLETDTLARAKIKAETARITQQTKALIHVTKRGKHQAEIAQHEAVKAAKEAGGTSKLDDFIDRRVAGLDQVVSE